MSIPSFSQILPSLRVGDKVRVTNISAEIDDEATVSEVFEDGIGFMVDDISFPFYGEAYIDDKDVYVELA